MKTLAGLALAAQCAAAVTCRAAAPTNVLYAAEYSNHRVTLYDQAPPHAVLGHITTDLCNPRGLATDTTGTLYVASDNGVCSTPNIAVLVFPPGATTPSRLITNGLTSPFALAATPAGAVTVADFFDHNILQFKPNQSTIARIVFPLVPSPVVTGVATNSAGTLYAAYYDGADQVGHIAAAIGPSQQMTDTGITLAAPGALAFDPQNNLIATDQSAGTVIVFAAGTTTKLHTYTGFSDPFAVALNPATNQLFVADAVTSTVTILSYPDGAVLGSFHATDVNGIALSPAPAGSN